MELGLLLFIARRGWLGAGTPLHRNCFGGAQALVGAWARNDGPGLRWSFRRYNCYEGAPSLRAAGRARAQARSNPPATKWRQGDLQTRAMKRRRETGPMPLFRPEKRNIGPQIIFCAIT